MESIVKKIGGSLYFHIPTTSVKAHNVEEGDIWQVQPVKVIRREPRG